MRTTIAFLILFVLSAGGRPSGAAGAEGAALLPERTRENTRGTAQPAAGRCPWSFRVEMILSNKGANPDTSFVSVGELAVGDRGRLYVLDRRVKRVQVFNADGKYLGPLARTGEGPGEISKPSSISVDGRGRVYVLDGALQRITVFSPDGGLVGTISLSLGVATDIRVDSAGNIYVGLSETFPSEMGKQDTRIVRIDTTGKVVVDFGTFPLMRMKPIHRGNSWVFVMTGFEPIGCWTVAADGRVAYGYGDSYDIPIYDKNGKLLVRIQRQCAPERVTHAEKQRVLQRYPDRELRSKIVVPDRKPAFRDVVFDDQGNLWVRISGDEEATYDVFNPTGEPICRSKLAGRILCFRSGSAYVVQSDQEGEWRLVRLRRQNTQTGP